MKLKNTFISLAVASILVGCGGSGSSNGGESDYTFTNTTSKCDTSCKELTKLEFKELFSSSVQADIDKQEADGWVDAHDSSIIVLSTNGKKVLGGSTYHNALTVLDLSSKTIKHNPFAALKEAGHGKDTSSGASENYLRNVTITSNNVVYANIPPKKMNSKKYDKDSFGLFKANVQAGGVVDYASAKKLQEKISNFALSDDEKTVVAYNGTDLIVLDKELTEKTSEEIKDISNFVVKGDKIYVLISNKESSYLSEYNISDLSKTDFKVDLEKGFETNSMKLMGNILYLFGEDHGYIKVIEVDLVNKSKKESSIKGEADSISLSPNGKYLAFSNHDDKQIVVVNMKNKYKKTQAKFKIDNGARALVFIDNDNIAYTKDRNEIAILKITDTKKAITIKEQLQMAVESIEKDINGGASLDVVIKDLKLSTKEKDVTFTWTSTVDGLAVDTGKVTRPESSATDVSGKLKVVAKNAGVSFEKEYDVTIRKKPMILGEVKSTQTGRMDYMAVNDDGSTLIAPVQFKVGEKNVYGIASYTLEDGKPVEKTVAKLYGSDEQIAGVGINGTNAIAVAKTTKENIFEGRIFTVKINADKTLANTVLNEVKITSGIPQKVEYNSTQTKAAVIIKKSDDKFITEVYDIKADGSITLANTISMGEYGYKTYGPAAINEDGTKVYQRDGESVHLSTSNGVEKTVKIDNLARVWAGANRVFVETYSGEIYSFDEKLEDKKLFNTGTGGRMYGGEVRTVNDKNYLFIPVQRSDKALNGIYKLEILADGSLKEISFSQKDEGADRMAVSKDASKVYFTFRDKSRKYNIAVVNVK